MLSFIFRLAVKFERQHGYWPNMLYLNPEQFRHWQGEFSRVEDFDQITRRLRMEIVISADALHPHVAWLPNRTHAIAS
ncbi:hypothetical protein Tel_14845 [Candidatus Tenderia electrophaga]|jgi:hypothetical protein|uniref:Uncharacterized protein n=1 Tax=Candidatus Tenderia electrophaga TaxID=1748243 RepID=A0A0S2TGN8_9GAMM|nr:hypothetical protein Tel_14845 [Candidatus Tenderia electrophaga]